MVLHAYMQASCCCCSPALLLFVLPPPLCVCVVCVQVKQSRTRGGCAELDAAELRAKEQEAARAAAELLEQLEREEAAKAAAAKAAAVGAAGGAAGSSAKKKKKGESIDTGEGGLRGGGGGGGGREGGSGSGWCGGGLRVGLAAGVRSAPGMSQSSVGCVQLASPSATHPTPLETLEGCACLLQTPDPQAALHLGVRTAGGEGGERAAAGAVACVAAA